MTWRSLGRGGILAAMVVMAVGCATPENIRAKSTASAQLYADILEAHGTFSRALEQELRRRDRIELQTDVQLGKRPPQLDSPFTPPASTTEVVNGLEDLDEVKAVTEKASGAFKGQ
jgi:hypothetical protein